MSNLVSGDIAMGMKSMGTDLLPPWVTWLWLLALTAVLILHCGHLARMGGQHWWFHASHILMLVSMLYMYESMELTWRWLSSSMQVVIFSMSTTAILVWMVSRFVQRRPFSPLWILALIMQAAMVYMWLPSWAPVLTWTLVGYYGIETIAWLSGRLDDSTWPKSVGPSAHEGPVLRAHDPAFTGANPAVGLGEDTKAATTVVPGTRESVVCLAHNTVSDRVSMAIMAARMAYMFAAMQLMR
jgi:hypothetical protein